MISCPADIYTAESSVTFEATATDNVTLNVPISYSIVPGSNFPIGESIVTATATDEALNTSTCNLKIIRD